MNTDICIIPGCGRVRDKKQNRKICQMHRVRYARHKSYDLPSAPQLPEGILKICKKHGALTAQQVYKRIKDKPWLSCRMCVKECNERARDKADYAAKYASRKHFYVANSSHKIDKELYLKILKEQNHVCAICKRPESIVNSTRNQKVKRLAIDHCHKTNTLRGLLCHKCNVSLGSMDDSIEILENAIAYLKKHKEKNAV